MSSGPRSLGILVPLGTVAIAFLLGGLAVVATGKDPLAVYKALWVGAGFDWPFHFVPGNPFGVDSEISEFNLQQTLLNFTPLVLTGLAVGFAFRCGLFNIGGQGQFWVGSYVALVVAIEIGGVPGMLLGAIGGALGGAIWAGIAGALKAFRGAHEVISTIMLNWIAIYGGMYLFGVGGPLADTITGQPVSEEVPESSWFPAIWPWGNHDLQPVHAGIFIAIAAAVAYWAILNRTTLGYEVRAVGNNPEAARYGGVSVRRSIVLSMGVAGIFAGLAGAGEVLGVLHEIGGTDIPVNLIGFTGIAVALLGRNSAVGILLAALLFAFLDSGARNLSGAFEPELASALAQIIQGIIILLVGGEALVRWGIQRGPFNAPAEDRRARRNRIVLLAALVVVAATGAVSAALLSSSGSAADDGPTVTGPATTETGTVDTATPEGKCAEAFNSSTPAENPLRQTVIDYADQRVATGFDFVESMYVGPPSGATEGCVVAIGSSGTVESVIQDGEAWTPSNEPADLVTNNGLILDDGTIGVRSAG